MKIRYGDIWDTYPQSLTVIPTNIGWKANGDAVMGAGLAKKAVERFPSLPSWWGLQCRTYRENTPVLLHAESRLILFPSKPLDDAPWLSWRQDSDLKLIWRSAAQLSAYCVSGTTISVPLVGCGNGNLPLEFVLPILQTFLQLPCFELVCQKRNEILVNGIIKGEWSNWLLKDDPRPSETGGVLGTHFQQSLVES